MSYITFNDIGIFDQLGSQMNNFAVGYTISKRTGHKIAILKTNLHQGYGQNKILEAFDYPFEIIEEIANFKPVELKEFPIDDNLKKAFYQNYSYDTISINDLDSKCNYNILGILHFPQHIWIDSIDDIRENFFKFKNKHKNLAKTYLSKIKNTKQIVSMHFRRKDYLVQQILNLSFEYYKEALTFFTPKEHSILIFSDDIEYCKNNLQPLFINSKSTTQWDVYISTNDPYVDLYLMSLCDHNIICNSTFSQWGALLNKNSNKQVICPAGILPNLKQYNVYEIFKDWTILTTT